MSDYRPETTATADGMPRRGLRGRMSLTQIALWISLLLHGITIGWLFGVRSTIRSEIGNLADAVVAAKSETLSYDLPIDQQVPIQVNIPVRQSLQIPINTEVRIKQNIEIPIETSLGSVSLPVPLDVTVPISTTVPINFDQTVAISTDVPLQLTVPIQLDLGSSQMAGYLDRIHRALLELRDRW
jgi:hypothetical protein